MPIEIKELIIRASVRDATDQSNNSNAKPVSQTNSSQEEQIVARCVEQIMDILKIQNER